MYDRYPLTLLLSRSRQHKLPAVRPPPDAIHELKSLAWKFLVMAGNLTFIPSSSFVILTWHPSRLVSVRPKARSSMSFSSSSASGMRSKNSSSLTMTWQVEQAQEPPHAPRRGHSSATAQGGRARGQIGSGGENSPSISRSFAWAMSRRLSPSLTASLTSVPSFSTKVT